MSEEESRRPAHLERRQRWEEKTSKPLTVLGLGFIACYSVLVLAPSPPGWLVVFLVVEIAITWVALAADLAIRLFLTNAAKRWEFVARHPIDVLAVMAPLFRAFRVVELVGRAPYFHRRTGAAVRAQIVMYAAAYAVLFVYFIALATLQVERDVPQATITDFGTAVWWACVTIATVGYGDTYPLTDQGRFYAVILMIGGVAIVGTATALMLSYIGDRVRRLSQPPDGEK